MPMRVVLHILEDAPEARDHIAMLRLIIEPEARLDADLPGAGGVPRAEAIAIRHPLREIIIGLEEELTRGELRIILFFEIGEEEDIVHMLTRLLEIVNVGIERRELRERAVALLIIGARHQMLFDPLHDL